MGERRLQRGRRVTSLILGRVTHKVLPSGLDALREKYQPVLDLIERQGGHIHNLRVEHGRLVLQASASSFEARAAIWKEIRLVDQAHSDLAASIRSESASLN